MHIEAGERPRIIKEYPFVVYSAPAGPDQQPIRKPDNGLEDEHALANRGSKRLMYTIGSNRGGPGNKGLKNVYVHFGPEHVENGKTKFKSSAGKRGIGGAFDLLIQGVEHIDNWFTGDDAVDIDYQQEAAAMTINTMKVAIKSGMIPETFMNANDLSNIANVVLQGQLSQPMDPSWSFTLTSPNTGKDVNITGQMYNAIIYKIGMDIYNKYNPEKTSTNNKSNQ